MSAMSKLNKLCKWRSVFSGWQLGTRVKGDPESDAVRDHRELSIILRVEMTALVGLLIEKGVFTAEEFGARIEQEAELLDKLYQDKFPGWESTEFGMSITNMAAARELMKNWKP
jgi:hypothetical protein